jgi:chromosomal replication initiation ATPase DnaA
MANARSRDQLALVLDHTEHYGREDFLEGPSNAAALHLIERWPDWPARAVALTGPEGAGKSHLAAIWAAHSGARTVTAASLTEADLPALVGSGALVVEDLAPNHFDERVLFHLLNLARQLEADLLLTARTAPAGWSLAIRDLASRLRALPVVELAPPDDALLRSLIVKLAADRQLPVDAGLVNYVATRIERSFAAARRAVITLDHEALRQQRPVTRALAVELFRDADQLALFQSDGNADPSEPDVP